MAGGEAELDEEEKQIGQRHSREDGFHSQVCVGTRERSLTHTHTLYAHAHRFLRLKYKLFDKDTDSLFSTWVNELLKKVVAVDDDDDDDDNDDDDADDGVFQDNIEPGEQGRINGREPGQPIVGLTQLKRDNAAKSWLFDKYYLMQFVNKNPEGDASDEPLLDESLWERT